MLLVLKSENFKDEDRRKWLAKVLSNIIDPISQDHFEVYNPNHGDTKEWVLDSFNNWRLTFFTEDTAKFRISFRHNSINPYKEINLSLWIKESGLCENISLE